MDADEFERSSWKEPRRKKQRSDDSENQREIHLAGTKLIASKDRCGVQPDKHEVTSWIEDKLANINLVDVKRSGLINAGCVAQTQLKNDLEIINLVTKCNVSC